jgi:hypothetical protein
MIWHSQVELGRVKSFRGTQLDSDSLTGARQRFTKEDLSELLNEKIEELMDQVFISNSYFLV